MIEISGAVRTWGFNHHKEKRQYIVYQTTFGLARKLFKPDLFDVKKGKGEQRGIVVNHAKNLKKAMEAGTYTPTAVSVGLRPRHLKALQTMREGDEVVAYLPLEDNDSLPLTDGGHRFSGLGLIREEIEVTIAAFTEETPAEQKAAAEAFLAEVDNQPIEAMILLNGNTQDDFINLQAGKNVDAAHLFSLRMQRRMTGDKEGTTLKLAYNVARMLFDDKNSPFCKQIRFDSKSKASYPVSSLCSKGSSDLGTSLVGLAKVGTMPGRETRSAEWLANTVTAAFSVIQSHAPALLKDNMVLTPPPDGTTGAATMLVGLGVTLAYYFQIHGDDVAASAYTAGLLASAKNVLDEQVNGNFSGPKKRQLLGEFCRGVFSDLAKKKVVPMHEGIPIELIKTLSTSTFNVSPLPKEPKATKATKVTKGKSPKGKKELPDVDGPAIEQGSIRVQADEDTEFDENDVVREPEIVESFEA